MVLYYMVAHFIMRTYGINQESRFVEGIWLDRKSHQIRIFFLEMTPSSLPWHNFFPKNSFCEQYFTLVSGYLDRNGQHFLNIQNWTNKRSIPHLYTVGVDMKYRYFNAGVISFYTLLQKIRTNIFNNAFKPIQSKYTERLGWI